ncbi:hypothetical protein BA011_25610 (plasmid) [Rhizobium leguminosarum]|uniref:Uncharacterized protein n=1 Tax=Rhizobium leguminosarum TaxID=384 RepID=A0A1B1CHN4_RHILE|nr:hypothetical protein BA011_25610 [Rhizobium leguminosarum]
MVLLGPSDQGFQGNEEGLPQLRQLIFHARRNLRIDGAPHEAVLLQMLQRLGQHLLRDVTDLAHQLVEAFLSVFQCLEGEQAPLIADTIEHASDRASRPGLLFRLVRFLGHAPSSVIVG